jgi:hypothetical protein
VKSLTGEALLLAINAGSSSLKIACFRIVDDNPEEELRIVVGRRSDAPVVATRAIRLEISWNSSFDGPVDPRTG